MAHSKRAQKRKKEKLQRQAFIRLSGFFVICICISGLGLFHFVFAKADASFTPNVHIDPNFSIKTRTIQFLEDNNAERLIPIIKCESQFRHYEPDGEVLKNTEGSSAIGVAQILSSMHPDPKIIYRYNKRNNLDLTVEDFDLTTFEGNIGYALVLYKVRGVQDWECRKKFRF